jgi:hypothetical protein
MNDGSEKIGYHLKPFALLIAANPFVIGCGSRGVKTKSSNNVKS